MINTNNTYDLAHELARSIKDSETYKGYIMAQRELDKSPEAKEKVRQFRALQMEVNQAQILGQNLPDDKVQELTIEYAKLNRDKTIADFFSAEGMFMQMFTDIQQIIQKSLESGFIE